MPPDSTLDFYGFAVAAIGISHLLQPPLTALLSRRLGLASSFSGLPALASSIATNMALTSVAMPTTLGVWLALHAHQALEPGAVRQLAVLLALFWSWRLYRQLVPMRLHWGPAHRAWIAGLAAIFVVQGPGLLALLALGARG